MVAEKGEITGIWSGYRSHRPMINDVMIIIFEIVIQTLDPKLGFYKKWPTVVWETSQ